MGTCYDIVNFTRKEYIHPSVCGGAGCKRGEFESSRDFAAVFTFWFVNSWGGEWEYQVNDIRLVAEDYRDQYVGKFKDVTLDAINAWNESVVQDLFHYGSGSDFKKYRCMVDRIVVPDEWYKERIQAIKHMDETLRQCAIYWYEQVDEWQRQKDPDWVIATEIQREWKQARAKKFMEQWTPASKRRYWK